MSELSKEDMLSIQFADLCMTFKRGKNLTVFDFLHNHFQKKTSVTVADIRNELNLAHALAYQYLDVFVRNNLLHKVNGQGKHHNYVAIKKDLWKKIWEEIK